MRVSWLIGLAIGVHSYAKSYQRGKVINKQEGRVEDGSHWLRDLPIQFRWTDKQVSFLKWRYNIVIPNRLHAVEKLSGGIHFSSTSQFPVNWWPRSLSKPITVIPVLVSVEFNTAFIEHVYNILNRLTTQAECVEFRWITMEEITDYENWVLLTPGPSCTTTVGLPSNSEGFHGGEVRVELGSECQTSDAVLRTMLLHTVGLTPIATNGTDTELQSPKVSGRQIAVSEPTAFKLCARDGPYSNCNGVNCKTSNPQGWTILREAVTHEEATRACYTQYGMQLATITTPEEQRVINYLLQNDDKGLERAKFWIGNKAVNGQLGQWRGNWASNYPLRQFLQAPVYSSYSASGWEWRNDLGGKSKLPAICEAKTAVNEKSTVKCLNNLCSAQSTCSAKGSAYSCRCLDGYFGNGFECSPTNCPSGTVKFMETCVKDPCLKCKPRFACEGVSLGSSLASCKCKAGWAGNANLCLPQKTIKREDILPTQVRTAGPMPAQMHAESLKKSHSPSGGFAALNALTSKLNMLKQDQQNKLSVSSKQLSPWRQQMASRVSTTTPKPSPTWSPTQASPLATWSPPKPIATREPIDIEKMKMEIAEFAQLASEQSAQTIESKFKLSQEQMKEEVERVLELVQAFISQSEAERDTLSSELERLRTYTSYFSDRIDQISTEVHEVEGLKKMSEMEQEQFVSLTKIAENLRYKINNIQNHFGSEVEKAAKNVSVMEGKVVETQMKVEKTEFDNLQNERRIENAEKRINDVEAVGLRSLQTEDRVLDAQEHLRHLDGLMDAIDSNVEYQKEKFILVEAETHEQDLNIHNLNQNVTHLDVELQNNEIGLNNLANTVNYRTRNIMKTESDLKKKVAGIEKMTGNFTGQLGAVSDVVEKNYVAFEVGLRHAATSAADARQKAQKTQTELAHFMRRQNRNSQSLNGKINRQNDLLAFLMNQVQKLERKLEAESAEKKLLLYGK